MMENEGFVREPNTNMSGSRRTYYFTQSEHATPSLR